MSDISVITVTLNSEKTLEQCIESVSNQKVTSQHILVDGNSTDGTVELIKKHQHRFDVVISEPDHGIYDAMNKGIQAATGDIVGFLNADDFYPQPDVLDHIARAFENPQVRACYGDLKYVGSNDVSKTIRYWKAGEYQPGNFYQGWMPPHPTFYVRREVLQKFGGFNTAMGSAADYELMLRILLRYQQQAAYIPKVLVHMRTGGTSNRSLVNRLKANRMDKQAWKVNGLKPYPWTFIAKPLRKTRQWMVTKDS
jgi:glycosyltransferase